MQEQRRAPSPSLLQDQAILEAEASSKMELLRTLYTVEVTRVKYMLRSYLRTRLLKIERYVMHCIDDAEMRSRLSQLEDSYAVAYLRLVGTHLKNTVTSKLPGKRRSLHYIIFRSLICKVIHKE